MLAKQTLNKKGEEAEKKAKACFSKRVELRAGNCLSEPKGHVHVTTAQSRVHTKRALGAGEGLRRMSLTSAHELERTRSLTELRRVSLIFMVE